MRFVNHAGRLTLISTAATDELHGAPALDVHRATDGAVPHDPGQALEQWADVLRLAQAIDGEPDVVLDRALISAPSPAARQIFGIGLNYADHGAESGMELPDVPLIFTKLQTALTGPFDPIVLTTDHVDWEVEIVVIVGARAENVAASDAWQYVAGITAGQDLSDRDVQMRPASSPQFGLGKSLAGFAPIGPLLVTPDEYANPDDIELACFLNGEEVQRSRSSKLIFTVSELIAYLSAIVTLLPGDVIFTGTPSGIGMARTPPRYLAPGDEVVSYVEGVGTMSHTFTAVPAASAPLTA